MRKAILHLLQNRSFRLALFISYSIAITIGSLLPHIGNSAIFSLGDKILHLLGYGVFTLLAWFIANTRIQFAIIALSIWGYGALIEIAQIYTGRSFSSADLLANGVGITIVYLLLRRKSSATRY